MIAEAVRNNAEWCHAVCRSYGIEGVFGPDTWTSRRRTPPLYPDAISLRSGASVPAILAAIEGGPDCSIKDSYANLDFSAAGFRILFDAEWITHPPVASGIPQWTVSRENTEFHPDLLTRKDIAFLAASDGTAGCIANQTGNVVGISNVFGPVDVWPDAIAAVSHVFPGLPIVGYESGDRLESALRHGFSAIGPLRVWIYSPPSTKPERTA